MRRGAWFVADSANFQVCSLKSEVEAQRVALHCECLRNRLTSTWNVETCPWTPRCQVVLHPHLASYLVAVGAGGRVTLGSSLATPARGPIRTRRIDLRTDVDDVLVAALPHELCHLVLADRFREAPAPLWFDEGVALLYDPPAKRALHERDLQLGLQLGTVIPLVDLLSQHDYPPAGRWSVFYGQSGSLVRCLLAHGSPRQLVEFVEKSRDLGISLALRETYHLGGIEDLRREWRREMVELSAELPPELSLPAVTTSQIVAQ